MGLLTNIENAAGMGSCDKLFPLGGGGKAVNDCGMVTFSNFPECKHVVGRVLPLPWNSLYIQAWQNFLIALSTELSTVSNKQALVSISIAGPSGASPEFILPATSNNSFVNPSAAYNCDPTGMTANNSTAADTMWTTLINNAQNIQNVKNGENVLEKNNPNYQMYVNQPSQVFVDYWNQAIDFYNSTFSGLTLVLTPDASTDFPEIGTPVVPMSTSIFGVDMTTANDLWDVDCYSNKNNTISYKTISCGAKVEILAHFVSIDVNASNNAKSTYVGGMTSSTCTLTGDIDLPGVKLLASSLILNLPVNSFVGGAQFDHAVSSDEKDRRQEGCPHGPNCSADQAAYNALSNFFYSTLGQTYFDATRPKTPKHPCRGVALNTQSASIEWVSINYDGIQYAKAEVCPSPSDAVVKPNWGEA